MESDTTMIRFWFDSLTPSMRFLLSWLIDQGGASRQVAALAAANRAAKPLGFKVTEGTARALLRRGHLERDSRYYIQVTPYAVSEACKYMDNPHPVPVMQARAEHLAHRDHANRVADSIKDAWVNRPWDERTTTTESDK